jgi:DNA-binding SARP family transcriptional activator
MYAETETVGQSEPWPEPKSPVEICLLGSFQLRKHGKQVGSRAGARTGGLLASLALAPDVGVARETLINMVWPENETSLAGQSLNTLVHKLSLLLSDALGGEPPVVHSAGMYRLNHEAGIHIDVTAFQRYATAGDLQRRSGKHACAEAVYLRAVAIYTGDLFVVGNAHAIMERERLRAWYLDVLDYLAGYAAARNNLDGIIRFASLMLTHDPCREDAHRQLMRCYARRGQRSQALRQYRVCEAILQAEFGVTPEEETTELFAQICARPDSV